MYGLSESGLARLRCSEDDSHLHDSPDNGQGSDGSVVQQLSCENAESLGERKHSLLSDLLAPLHQHNFQYPQHYLYVVMSFACRHIDSN